MGQRYIVFLNDRTIEISEIINTEQAVIDELPITYQNKEQLSEDVERFMMASHCRTMKIFTGEHFKQAWEDFCGIFKMIHAAGGIVLDDKGQLLFIRRLGKWDLPKGKIEAGESPRDAAIREVQEETGLNELQISGPMPETYHIYTTISGKIILKKTYWFMMKYTGMKEPIPQTEEDISEVRWFTAGSLDIIKADTYSSLLPLLEML